MMIITSSSNERVKDIRRLQKSAKDRRERGLYVVEGIRMFREIPKENIREIYVTQSAEEKYHSDISAYGIEPVIVDDKVFCSMSDTATPQGIMALVSMSGCELCDLCSCSGDDKPFLLIIERLQDPGNMGTIIRTAEGSGVTGIIMSSDCVDIYNPKTVRSTMGSIFRMPVYVADELNSSLKYLREQGITVYGAHLDGESLYDKNFRGGCGFLIGNEGNGLSADVSMTADELIRIPMMGNVESLNAAVSTAVISYEVLRQRHFSS